MKHFWFVVNTAGLVVFVSAFIREYIIDKMDFTHAFAGALIFSLVFWVAFMWAFVCGYKCKENENV